MRSFALRLSLALCPLVTGVPTAGAAGSVERITVESAALGHPVAVSVYRPAAEPAPGRRWPVLYLLHGLSGDDAAWLTGGDIARTLDHEIATGRLEPVLVVMPDAGDSWYVDAPEPGAQMAEALTTDLPAAIDARYPTAACREGRAVAGLSMGGYGAVLYALMHPERYRAAISLSGSLFQPVDAGAVTLAAGPPPTVFRGAYGDPFDPARFNAWTVFERLDAMPKDAAKPAFWVEAGDDDFVAILEGTVAFHVAARRAGFESELRVEDGAHDWNHWKRAIVPALEWLSPRLAVACLEGTP